MLEMWVGAEVQRDKGEKDKMVVSVELVMIYGKGLEHLSSSSEGKKDSNWKIPEQ